MKGLIEAAKTSPTALDKYISENIDHVSHETIPFSDPLSNCLISIKLQGDVFLTQLDSELEDTPPGTTKYDIITLFKARILEEAGKR
jgi:hypothetical protein